MRIRYEIRFEGINAEVYAESSRFAAEAVRAFRTVTALTMEESIIRRYSDLLTRQRRKAVRKAWSPPSSSFSWLDTVCLQTAQFVQVWRPTPRIP